jgi:cytochrome c peroxidase
MLTGLWLLALCLPPGSGFGEAATRGTQAYDRAAAKLKYRRPETSPQPPGNGTSPARVELGKLLFFDPRLSGSGLISCATCHNPSFAWGDAMDRAVGWQMKRLVRRTPTILNVAWADTLFWDGRAASLEEQAVGPIASPDEMNVPIEDVLKKIRSLAGYRTLFQKAYPAESDSVNKDTLAKAIASFERTVVSSKAPFDEWIEGREQAIPESAKLGFDVFNTRGNCSRCHTGWNFSDDGFHDLGISTADPGRGKFFPGKEDMQFTFKTPTLRNVARRAPYMHDGSVDTLEAVIELYDKGPRIHRESISPDFVKLNLSADEKRELIDFLSTLTSQDRPVELPLLPVR